jgi:hypothetical protein
MNTPFRTRSSWRRALAWLIAILILLALVFPRFTSAAIASDSAAKAVTPQRPVSWFQTIGVGTPSGSKDNWIKASY